MDSLPWRYASYSRLPSDAAASGSKIACGKPSLLIIVLHGDGIGMYCIWEIIPGTVGNTWRAPRRTRKTASKVQSTLWPCCNTDRQTRRFDVQQQQKRKEVTRPVFRVSLTLVAGLQWKASLHGESPPHAVPPPDVHLFRAGLHRSLYSVDLLTRLRGDRESVQP